MDECVVAGLVDLMFFIVKNKQTVFYAKKHVFYCFLLVFLGKTHLFQKLQFSSKKVTLFYYMLTDKATINCFCLTVGSKMKVVPLFHGRVDFSACRMSFLKSRTVSPDQLTNQPL